MCAPASERTNRIIYSFIIAGSSNKECNFSTSARADLKRICFCLTRTAAAHENAKTASFVCWVGMVGVAT